MAERGFDEEVFHLADAVGSLPRREEGPRLAVDEGEPVAQRRDLCAVAGDEPLADLGQRPEPESCGALRPVEPFQARVGGPVGVRRDRPDRVGASRAAEVAFEQHHERRLDVVVAVEDEPRLELGRRLDVEDELAMAVARELDLDPCHERVDRRGLRRPGVRDVVQVVDDRQASAPHERRLAGFEHLGAEAAVRLVDGDGTADERRHGQWSVLSTVTCGAIAKSAAMIA